jgi:Transposase, Mutator family
MTIRKELIDELIASSGGKSLIGPDGLVKELTKALVERMLAGELNHHLGYEKHEVAGYGSGNSRNGKSQKTLKGEAGEMTIEGATRPQRHLRAQADREAPDALRGLRCEDSVHVLLRSSDALAPRARDDGTRYSRASAGDVWRGGERGADFGGDR